MNGYFKEALKLFGRAKVVFIGSVDAMGFPNIKAVLVAGKGDNLAEVVIKTNTSSLHVEQFRDNPNGCLYFYTLLGFKGVLLKGTFSVVEDVERKMRYWKRGDEKYYRKGVEDFCLLVFRPRVGRFYHRFRTGDFEIG